MTHEQVQREHAQDIVDGKLPEPGEKFQKLIGDSTATVRWLQYTEAKTVCVHYQYCDEPGCFVGRDSLQLEEFRERYPIKLEDE